MAATYILDYIIREINTNTCVASILTTTTPAQDADIIISVGDVEGLSKTLAAGSIIKTPKGDYMAFTAPTAQGVTTFKKKLSSGGSENPNSKQVITGTIGAPFGEISVLDFGAALQSGNASAMLTFDASALGFDTYTQPMYSLVGDSYIHSGGAGIGSTTSLCNMAAWTINGELYEVYLEENGTITDISLYASVITTSLTIYWHPMPLA